jgi:Uma2 family endonuclease
MSSVVKILPYYTYEDYVQWEGKWELIDGIPYEMSPALTPKHQLIANTLGALFYIALKSCRHCKAYQAIDYKITEDTIFQPDISIICKEAGKNL